MHAIVLPLRRIEYLTHLLLRLKQVPKPVERGVASVFALVLLDNKAQVLLVLKVYFPHGHAAAVAQLKFRLALNRAVSPQLVQDFAFLLTLIFNRGRLAPLGRIAESWGCVRSLQ